MWNKLAAQERRCSDGFILLDKRWRCLLMNDAAAELLEVDAADAVDKSVWEIFGSSVGGNLSEQWQRACGERLPANLGEYCVAQGRYVACRCWPAGEAALLSFVDVTDYGEPLQAAADERKRVESFLAVLAHELRNPLSGLCQGVAVLRATGAEIDREIVLDRLERQLRYFVTVVDDLLDVSRIVRGRVNVRKERVQIDDVVAEALEAVCGMARGKSVGVHSEVPVHAVVYGDPVRLQQVLINLLKNAIAAADAGGDVFVSARETDAVVEIEVRDAGRGIEPERLQHLFEPAYEYRDGDGAGLGVGLGVVKRLVELHDGRVTAHSDGRGHGATFVVQLPSAN